MLKWLMCKNVLKTFLSEHYFPMRQLIFLVIFVHSLTFKAEATKSPSGILKDSPMTEVMSAVGRKVLLPCSITPSEPNDRPILVLFYQGAIGTPVYSLDARGGSLDNGDRWSDPVVFGSRAQFDLSRQKSGLIVEPVTPHDEALYRCRVDFRLSPTRNSRIRLTVIVPPKAVTLMTEEGVEAGKMIGPHVEGSSLTLHCTATGGRPRPLISWWKGNYLLDEESEVQESHMIANTLIVPKLSREDLNQNFTCRVISSNITAPVIKSAKLDMIFRIQKVEIEGSQEATREGTAQKLVCKASGSRPVADITWWKNGVEVPSTFEKVQEYGNVLKSSMMIIPKVTDDQAHIVCRAKNPALETDVMEDTKKLRVHYSPRLNLVTGKGLIPDDVKEGDDFYFECEILANPRAHITHWFYEGSELQHNVSMGVIHSNQSLVLQKVKKEMTGTYQCAASNQLGNGTSNDLFLKVKYAPLCSHEAPTVYGADKNEEIKIPCQNHAFPKPFDYTWAFNSSSELVDVSEIKDQQKRTISYIPREDVHFGTLLCWAENEVGRQKVPCLYHIIHSALPEPVSNCIFNVSSVSATIDCEEGWNGGLDQTFTLQLSPNQQQKLTKQTRIETKYTVSGHKGSKGDPKALANTSVAPKPSFVLNDLEPGIKYFVKISAVNKKGKSSPRNFYFVTPTDAPERQVSQGIKEFDVSWTFIVCVLAGIVVGGVVLTTTGFCFRSRLIASRRRSLTAEVALERQRSTFRDKEELMECLTTASADGEGTTLTRDHSL